MAFTSILFFFVFKLTDKHLYSTSFIVCIIIFSTSISSNRFTINFFFSSVFCLFSSKIRLCIHFIFISLYFFSVMLIKIKINFIILNRIFFKNFFRLQNMVPIFDFTSCSGHLEISKSGIINCFLNPSIALIPLFFHLYNA